MLVGSSLLEVSTMGEVEGALSALERATFMSFPRVCFPLYRRQ